VGFKIGGVMNKIYLLIILLFSNLLSQQTEATAPELYMWLKNVAGGSHHDFYLTRLSAAY
jgi:hypothetical protein